LDNSSSREGKGADVEGEMVVSGVKSDTSNSAESGLEANSETPLFSGLVFSIETADRGDVDSHTSLLNDHLRVRRVISSAVHVTRLVVTELLGETREEVVEGVSVHGDGGILGKHVLSDVDVEFILNLEVIQEGLRNILTEEHLESSLARGVNLRNDSGVSEGHNILRVIFQVNGSIESSSDVTLVDSRGGDPSVVDCPRITAVVVLASRQVGGGSEGNSL